MNNCPKCGAAFDPLYHEPEFICGSREHPETGLFYESGRCIERQRDALAAKVATLEARVKELEEALTNLVVELDAYLRPWNQPQKDPANKASRLSAAEDRARHQVAKAKETKP